MLLNELDRRPKDFVYVTFMRSGKVQQTRTEENLPGKKEKYFSWLESYLKRGT